MSSRFSSIVPRWKTIIDEALSKYKNQNVMQVATLETLPNTMTIIPRVRSHIFRNFLSSSVYPSLPLLISSTDVRTPKVSQITSNPSGSAEIVWWIEGAGQQSRFKCSAYIVPHPTHPLYSIFKDKLENANLENGDTLALFKNDDWEARCVELFKTMSAHMKASWCRPIPGSPLKGGQEEVKKWPERVEEPDPDATEEEKNSEEYQEKKKNWEKALGNFALVVIEPSEVDFVDLAVIPNRRWLYQKTKSDDGNWGWKETELVP